MPRGTKGPRLYLRRKRTDTAGTHAAIWIIRDGSRQTSTGCFARDIARAERALAAYLADKHTRAARSVSREPDQIPIADILTIYLRDVVPGHSRPKETKGRIKTLDSFFGDKMLSHVTGEACRAYVKHRSTDAAARRELEDLRAAINHHRREGFCNKVVEVLLPPERPARARWLTRLEAARLIRAAWRYREVQKDSPTSRRSRQHVARFILVSLYTGTRASAVCGAALEPTPQHGWIDLENGVFYRRPPGQPETAKRQPPVPLPDRLLAHLRRWKNQGQRFAVEWQGKPVQRVSKAFAKTVTDAGLSDDVTPHVLRHTAATWLMQAATDLWRAAGYLGMTVEMLSERYGHHHPDHLAGAREAFTRHRRGRVSVAETVAGGTERPAKYWSEWQDLNLRPPRPERGALPG
jgi:integrase